MTNASAVQETKLSTTVGHVPELDGKIELPVGDFEFWLTCTDDELVELASAVSGAGYVLTADCVLACRHGWLSC